jgi:hypothetical protein
MIKIDSISEFTHYQDEAHLKYEIIRKFKVRVYYIILYYIIPQNPP